MMSELSISLATFQSHRHITDDIPRGVKIYERGGVEFEERESNHYWAQVPHKDDTKSVSVRFSRDGRDLECYTCQCTALRNRGVICRHVVAAVLAIQGGVVESKLTLGKIGTASVIVNDSKTAHAVGSGSLNVFATPMMIALMEKAACECLAEGLEAGETSVGTEINVSHTAASPIGAEIIATAIIEYIFGRRLEFTVVASDGEREIGSGKHTRMIVDAEKFMGRIQK